MIPLFVMVASVSANEASLDTLERECDKRIVPLIETYCQSCHDTEIQEAKLDLTVFRRLRDVTQSPRVWSSHHLDAVIALAARAYRRPVSSAEEKELREFYRWLRKEDELSHEEAIQDTIVSLLMSPRFCYRLDLLSDSENRRPLDDFELASRLSYFLWSSIPDAELRQPVICMRRKCYRGRCRGC